ncbi:hypothetical protein, partial [Bilophila sp.]|uniref:hypothetical protein n=1 Tax=Bilophila sp. TaxID=1929485 RepID=UPI003076ABF6
EREREREGNNGFGLFSFVPPLILPKVLNASYAYIFFFTIFSTIKVNRYEKFIETKIRYINKISL